MPEPSSLQRLLRERMLNRYITALEKGDLDALGDIMKRAERDALLEAMILELHETYQTDEQFLALIQEENAMEIEGGIHKSRPRAAAPEPGQQQEPEITPHSRRRFPFWLRVLAALLLVGMIFGSFLVVRNLRSQSMIGSARPAGWCSIPALGLRTDLGAPTLEAVTAASAHDIWMVGFLAGQTSSVQAHTLIEHWDGKHLVAMASQDTKENGARLMDVAELSPNDVWAVGSELEPESQNVFIPARLLPGIHTLIEHWNGQQWSIVPSPDGKTGANALNELQSVAAVSAHDVWAVGYAGLSQNQIRGTSAALVEHWNGHVWSVVQLPASFHASLLSKVVASPNGDVWALGLFESGPTSHQMLVHWDGRQWSRVTSLDQNVEPFWLSLQSANQPWIVGTKGVENNHKLLQQVVIERWDGANWQNTAIPYPTLLPNPQNPDNPQAIAALAAPSVDDVWAVGGEPLSFFNIDDSNPADTYQLFVQHWNGQNWQKVSLPQPLIGVLNIVTVVEGKVWAAGTTFTGLQHIPGQIVETTCSR
jgi:hypothetical protein